MVGEKILGYTVNEKIGSGGFGTVYKVSKTNASGTYIRALKHITIPNQKQYADVLNSMGGDYSKADDYFAGILKEIVNEIKIISTLSEAGTQNIVRYYENDIVESISPKKYDIYILMECLTPFTDYLYQNELKVRDVVKLGKDILTALTSCHSQNVIHRDIKDDNIFVSMDGVYKLGDFGVSKMLKDRSRAESMKGTPNFIAPEVYLGKEQYDATVDIYSLGIVLYKLLNKSRNPFLPEFPQPYNSNDEDVAFEKRMKGEVPELPYAAKNVLGEAVVKAIRKRSDRYNSAREFLDAIESAENQLTNEDLDVVVNQIIPQPKEEKKNKTNTMMDATIGIDMDVSVNKKSEDKADRDLFRTVSDIYNKTPVKVETEILEQVQSKKRIIPIICVIIASVGIIVLIVFGISKKSDTSGSVSETTTEPEVVTTTEKELVEETSTTQQETTTELETTTQQETTTQPETTTLPETTIQPETTTQQETTTQLETTTQPETTQPETTTQQETTTQPQTTKRQEETTTEGGGIIISDFGVE